MKKVLAIVLAFAMLLPVLSVNIFAAEDGYLFMSSDYDTFIDEEAGTVASGWVPAVFDWSCGSAGTDFFTACETEGAIVEVITSPNSTGGDLAALCMQTGNWDGVNFYTEKLSTTTKDGKTITLFDANGFLDFITSEGKDYTVIGNVALDIPDGCIIWAVNVHSGNVAQYNGTEYKTLSEAIDVAAVSGGTVELIYDTAGSGFVIPSNVTLDLNGHDYTITAADSSARITTAESIVVEGTLIIDGTVTATEGQPAITIKEGANVTIAEGAVVEGDIVFDVTAENIDTFFETTNIKVTGGEVNGNFPSVEEIKAIYENSLPTYTGNNLGLYVGNMSDGGLNSRTSISAEKPNEYTLSLTGSYSDWGWIMVKSATGAGTSGAEVALPAGTKLTATKVVINGSEIPIINADYTIPENRQMEWKFFFNAFGPDSSAVIGETKPDGTDPLTSVSVTFVVDTDNYISDEQLTTTIQNAVSVTGGKFASADDVKGYLDDGYTVDGSGNVVLAPTDPIVVTNSTGTTAHYTDMETALANVQDGDTITLRNNVEVHKMVDITVSNVILDLGGFTLTAADDFSYTMGNKNDAHVINISANGVTVRNGTVKATANNKHAINVYQVDGAVLENVTADHTDSTTGAPIVIGGSDVTVKGRLTTITGTNSWYAINVDSYAGMESNITFAQNSTVAFEGVSPLGIYIETNSTADTDDVTVTFDKNVSVIAPEGVSDFTAVATDENATNASVVNPGNAGLKDNGDGTYGVAPIETSKKISGCIYLNEDYHALIVNGRFIVYPHADNGSGFCTACKGVIVADTAE